MGVVGVWIECKFVGLRLPWVAVFTLVVWVMVTCLVVAYLCAVFGGVVFTFGLWVCWLCWLVASLVCCLGFSFMILLVVWLVGLVVSLGGFLLFAFAWVFAIWVFAVLRVVGFAVTTSLWYFVLVWVLCLG